MTNNILDVAVIITKKEMILNAERRSLAEKIFLLKVLVLREIKIMIESNQSKRKHRINYAIQFKTK